jgi:hypothetical protein
MLLCGRAWEDYLDAPVDSAEPAGFSGAYLRIRTSGNSESRKLVPWKSPLYILRPATKKRRFSAQHGCVVRILGGHPAMFRYVPTQLEGLLKEKSSEVGVFKMVLRPQTKAKLAKKSKRCPKCGKIVRAAKRCKTCHAVQKS